MPSSFLFLSFFSSASFFVRGTEGEEEESDDPQDASRRLLATAMAMRNFDVVRMGNLCEDAFEEVKDFWSLTDLA